MKIKMLCFLPLFQLLALCQCTFLNYKEKTIIEGFGEPVLSENIPCSQRIDTLCIENLHTTNTKVNINFIDDKECGDSYFTYKVDKSISTYITIQHIDSNICIQSTNDVLFSTDELCISFYNCNVDKLYFSNSVCAINKIEQENINIKADLNSNCLFYGVSCINLSVELSGKSLATFHRINTENLTSISAQSKSTIIAYYIKSLNSVISIDEQSIYSSDTTLLENVECCIQKKSHFSFYGDYCINNAKCDIDNESFCQIAGNKSLVLYLAHRSMCDCYITNETNFEYHLLDKSSISITVNN